MINPLVRLDGALLGAAQKFCDKFQRLTGFTKFRLEKWALVVSTLFLWTGIITQWDVSSVFPGLFNTFVAVVLVRDAERKEKAFLESRQLRLPVWHSATSRIVADFLAASLVPPSLFRLSAEIALVLVLMMTFYVVAIYFEACVPRPPSKSEMREWYERALTALNDWLKPEPALVPIPVSNR